MRPAQEAWSRTRQSQPWFARAPSGTRTQKRRPACAGRLVDTTGVDQLTLTALQAAATALYVVEPTPPYRSAAACSEAARAPA